MPKSMALRSLSIVSTPYPLLPLMLKIAGAAEVAFSSNCLQLLNSVTDSSEPEGRTSLVKAKAVNFHFSSTSLDFPSFLF